MLSYNHLLILNSYPYIGGAEKFIVALAVGLQEKGWEITLGLREGSDLIREAQSRKLQVLPLPLHGDFDPVSLRKIALLNHQKPISLIFSTDERSLRVGGLFIQTHGHIPHVARLRSVWDPHEQLSKIRKFRFHIIYSVFLDQIVTNSLAARLNLIFNFGLPASRIRTIYNGLFLPYIHQTPGMKGKLRKKLGLSPQAFLITVVGRISRPKNQFEAIEIAEHLFPDIPDAYLLLVGKVVDTVYYQEILKKINTSRYKERILVLDYQENIAPVMLDSDVILSTSIAEGLPNVFIEAGYFRKPVICRDVCGNREIIQNGVNGYLLPESANSRTFAEAIIHLYENPYRIQEMGEQAHRIVQQRFSYSKMIENYHKLFTGIVKSFLKIVHFA